MEGTEVEYVVFARDLDRQVRDIQLLAHFRKYHSVRSAKIVIEPSTGGSKGFGFVRFGNEMEALEAMAEMNNTVLGSKTIRLSQATKWVNDRVSHDGATMAMLSTPTGGAQLENLSRRTLLITNLDTVVGTDAHLRSHFAPYGPISALGIMADRQCAYVEYEERKDAETALVALQGTPIGSAQIQVAWSSWSAKDLAQAAQTDGQWAAYYQQLAMAQWQQTQQAAQQTPQWQATPALPQPSKSNLSRPFDAAEANGRFLERMSPYSSWTVGHGFPDAYGLDGCAINDNATQ